MRQCPHCNEWISDRAERCLLCGHQGTATAAAHDPAAALRRWLAERASREERLALVLACADGLSAAEIGEVLGVSGQFAGETLRLAREGAREAITIR